MMNKQKLLSTLRWLREELNLSLRTLQEKGPKHFARPLLISFVVLIAVYKGWYQITEKSLKSVELDLESAKAKEKYSDRFKDDRNKLDSIAASLPRTRDRSGWLNETIRGTLRDAGIVPLQLSEVEEREITGYVLASMTIRCRVTYRQLGAWIAQMEHSRYLLHMTSLRITKGANDIGAYAVDVTVTTVFSKDGGIH